MGLNKDVQICDTRVTQDELISGKHFICKEYHKYVSQLFLQKDNQL